MINITFWGTCRYIYSNRLIVNPTPLALAQGCCWHSVQNAGHYNKAVMGQKVSHSSTSSGKPSWMRRGIGRGLERSCMSWNSLGQQYNRQTGREVRCCLMTSSTWLTLNWLLHCRVLLETSQAGMRMCSSGSTSSGADLNRADRPIRASSVWSRVGVSSVCCCWLPQLSQDDHLVSGDAELPLTPWYMYVHHLQRGWLHSEDKGGEVQR